MRQTIDFYFDFASPYGYLARVQIDAWAKDRECNVVWRPIMLGAALKVVGTSHLLSYPIKGAYATLDIARSARALGVACLIPQGFPHNTLAAARGFYWLSDQDDKMAKNFGCAFHNSYFGEGRDISSAEATADIAAGVGIDQKSFLAAIQSPAIKDRLKEETAAAIERGVFGSPFFFLGDEPFWGSDRLDQMARWLETGGW